MPGGVQRKTGKERKVQEKNAGQRLGKTFKGKISKRWDGRTRAPGKKEPLAEIDFEKSAETMRPKGEDFSADGPCSGSTVVKRAGKKATRGGRKKKS